MASPRKVIISCAVTGSIHTPSMSPHLPVSAEEIAEAGILAAQAGAAIIHLHARHPEDGRPSQDPEHFAPILERLKRGTNAIVNITTGGSPHMSVEERMRPMAAFEPELASLNMGSMNFGLFPMLDRTKEFRYDWEREGLEKSRDLVFKNTYSDIQSILEVGARNGTKFEFECYDTSHLSNLDYFRRSGLTNGPLLVQSVFGLLGGAAAHPEDLLHMRRTADRLFDSGGYEWSILAAGRHQMPLATMGAAMGSHVRVGLEDSLWIAPGQLAKSNAEQVTRIRTILEALGLEPATPDEARDMLQLKGPNAVGF